MESKPEQLDTSHMELQKYNPEWKEIYEKEAERIRDVLGSRITQIEHIGSTSVPGLASKSIIDMVIEVPNSQDADVVIELLESVGYPFSNESHNKEISTERHLLRKGIPTQFHLSVCYGDKGSFLERQILFRDYLRKHDEARDEYDALKREALKKDPTGKGEYIDNKTDFVMRILKKAGFQNKWFDLSKY